MSHNLLIKPGKCQVSFACAGNYYMAGRLEYGIEVDVLSFLVVAEFGQAASSTGSIKINVDGALSIKINVHGLLSKQLRWASRMR